MLVFLSDVHLTDGTSGETIKPTAFKIFADNVTKLIESVYANSSLKELRIVLLGDIFDVIRSTKWLDVKIRPWNNKGSVQEQAVMGILKGIFDNPLNQKSIRYLHSLQDLANSKSIDFRIEYIPGNHDWIINRYGKARQLVAQNLGMNLVDPQPFPTTFSADDYKTIARHGDIYDEFNYMGNRDASSLGDAIVIELLNRYPTEVDNKLSVMHNDGKVTQEERDYVTTSLKEIDNIRPLLDIPSWILMVSNKLGNEYVKVAIEKAWDECVDAFLKVKFVRDQDKFLRFDAVDKLEAGLRLSSTTSKWALEQIAGLKKRFTFAGIEGDYHKHAFSEAKVKSGDASYVLYGHTHDYLIVPMDQVPAGPRKVQDKIYFNTGTWRKTWNKVAFDAVNREFTGWHVLTYVCIFHPDENGDYNFEVYSGALG